MPFKDPEEQKVYRKRYYAQNPKEAYRKTAEWRKKNRAKRNKTERIRNAVRFRTDPAFRERRRLYARQSYRKHRAKRLLLRAKHAGTEKDKARALLKNALRRGDIVRPTLCDACGATGKVHGHHPDHQKPLSVVWLCPLCHGAVHRIEP